MDGLDQPSTAGAPAALPGSGRTIRQHAPRVEGVRRTSWGVPAGWKDEAAELLSSVRRTPQGMVCGAHPRVWCVRRTLVCSAADAALRRKGTPQSVTTRF